jgi:peptidoglycan/LPS O-acetylase OafA/YrhL
MIGFAMPMHVSTGLLIFAAVSLILGFMISAGQKSDDSSSRHRDDDRRSVLRMIADVLFFWVSDDFRYLVAYPWLILAINVAVAQFAPYSYPGRVFQCDGDIYACLGVYDLRPHG